MNVYMVWLNFSKIPLVHELRTESNEISYLRGILLVKNVQLLLLKSISFAEYNLEKLVTELNKSIWPKRIIEKDSTSY